MTAALILVSCGEKEDTTIKVASVTVSLPSLTMEVGQTQQLEAEILPEDATNKTVTWASSDEAVATVSETGLVTVQGAGLAEITANSGGKSGIFTVIVPVETAVAVDMGLPSGLKWASYNLGATKPEEFGDYYAWGEVTPQKTDYTWETYKWCAGSNITLTKYCTDSYYGKVDNLTELQRGEKPGETVDDAARARLGGKWRMPTAADYKELFDNCDVLHGFTTYNGVTGFKFINNNDHDKWIFVPAAAMLGVDFLAPDTSYWRYWSSTLSVIEEYAGSQRITLEKNTSYVGFSMELRYCGLTVRPVTE